ncbi:related to sgt1 protein [Cephalotrichum gorgonifer]|uniref:Related to sgt1 protein n=1 Tax=Cephalotrichum gorgonifer TaxID=2041049 RepID=A0AAE8MXY6_9PEZI|nr:related to sgt1 protein [Cephalotrichum gorgonifer]
MEDSIKRPKTWEEIKDQYGGLDIKLAENYVEYALFVLPENEEGSSARKQLSLLETIRKYALDLSARLTANFIWQRGEFNLSMRNEPGLMYLHGKTDYGDSVEDEWLIVYIIREVTKAFPQAWARVWDADGEFLLVEAANVVPKWLNPVMDANRSWIHDGRLYIIPADEKASKPPKPLSLPDAVSRIKADPGTLYHSLLVETEALYRLEKYPAYITSSLHHASVTVPRKLAYILHEQPKAVAPAVEKFYLRDSDSLKPLFSHTDPLTFPPEDFVTLSVRFTKVLYAQLYSQRFDPPPKWEAAMERIIGKTPAATDAEFKTRTRAEVGMKLSCGFEMMMRGAEKSNNRIIREVSLLLEDLEEDGLDTLPTDKEIRAWKDVDREDDESWMDINFDDLEKELRGKSGNTAGDPSKSGFGDPNAQADLRKMVSRFESFMNDDKAGVEGAEPDDEMDTDDDTDDDEDDSDDEVDFDENTYANIMREMMGIPMDTTPAPAEHAREGGFGEDSGNDSETEEINRMMVEMETELNEHDALKLDPTPAKLAALKDAKGKQKEAPSHIGDLGDRMADVRMDDDDSGDEEVDVDYNLVKNLLESFKGQAGLAGPVSNILGMMGMQLPRDEDDGEEHEGSQRGNNRARLE